MKRLILRKNTQNRISLNIMIMVFFIFSCKPYEKLYLEDRLSGENDRDSYTDSCNSCLFILFENSLVGKKVIIKDNVKDSVYYNDYIRENNNGVVAEKIITLNRNDVLLSIDKNNIIIPAYTYPAYRYIIITKPFNKKKYTLTFTNVIRYW